MKYRQVRSWTVTRSFFNYLLLLHLFTCFIFWSSRWYLCTPMLELMPVATAVLVLLRFKLLLAL